MSIQKLGDKRYRAQVYDPATGKNVSVGKVLGLESSVFASPRAAARAREQAREKLKQPHGGVTVTEFRSRWLHDPLFTVTRPKESTRVHNEERTRAFAARYGDTPLREIGDAHVQEWLTGGRNLSTVPVLKAMFNDAASAEAGRLIDRNPWIGVKIRKRSRGKDDVPTQEMITAAVQAARDLKHPWFAAWLDVACHTGLRPGELDALRWDAVDWDADRILVSEQWSPKTGTFTLPKNGLRRLAPLTPPARRALAALPRDRPFCFVNFRGEHFTPGGRAYHWKAVRTRIGWEGPLYLLTRHWAGWYMINELGLTPEDTAVALGHTDGGSLVRSTYGHLDSERALDRVVAAYKARTKVVQLRAVKEESA